MMMGRVLLALSAGAMINLAIAVQAQIPNAPPASAGSINVLPAMPPVQTQGNITYVSGGIGAAEQQALHQAAPNFNLQLQFAGPGGEFLSNVKVKITEAQGGNIVLEAVSNGPYFMAKLQSGNYNVSADDGDGHPQMRAVTVPDHGASSQSFVWSKAPG